MKPIIFLNPVFKQMLWGGNQLRSSFGYDIPGDDTGECWAVSAHPNGDCTVKEGIYEGMPLSQLWVKHPELFGNLGKTECWYILNCPEGATLVAGHNAGTRQELAEMIHQGRWSELIREIPVKKGDFIQINPGTVHAIKGGMMILETQQNSDITYRVYDYGRLTDGKPRQLHVEQSIDVITVPALSAKDSVKEAAYLPENTMNELISCDYYRVWKLEVAGGFSFEQEYPFLIMSVTDGEGTVNGKDVKKGDHFILPKGFGEVDLQGKMQLIVSTAN